MHELMGLLKAWNSSSNRSFLRLFQGCLCRNWLWWSLCRIYESLI